MRSLLRFVSPAALAVSLAACGEGIVEVGDVGDAHELTSFEGQALVAQLDSRGVSPVLPAAGAFLRLGVIWDAADDGALEVRSSADGESWSAWRTADVVYEEDGFRTGHVDTDADASFFQFRIPDGKAAPSFVAFDPIDVLLQEAGGPPTGEEESDGPEDGSELGEGYGMLEQGLGPRFTVHSRREWGARAPRCIEYASPNRATIHHSAGPSSGDPKRLLRGIQAYHMDSRGYCDIAYNYLVSRDARVWRGRGARRIGGHTYNANTGNVGICFIGTHTSVRPTDDQMWSTAHLLKRLHERFPAIRLNRDDVKGHRQYGASGGSTACPGDALYRKLDTIVRRARDH